MTRRSLFKAILGGIGAIFLPKLDKKTDIAPKEIKLNKWMRIEIIGQSSPDCTVSIYGDDNWSTVTCCGVYNEDGLYICEAFVDGNSRMISKIENGIITKYYIR